MLNRRVVLRKHASACVPLAANMNIIAYAALRVHSPGTKRQTVSHT